MNVRVVRSSSLRGRPSPYFALWISGLLAGVLSVQAAAWSVPTAPLRFSYRLSGSPSHPEAGYLAQIPDGGLLPSPNPRTQVVAEDGSTVESYTLWHGADTGLWIVFADPRKGQKVDIYVSPSNGPNKWNPETGLRPGPLLVTGAGTASLSTARKYAGFGNLGKNTHVQHKGGIAQAPLSVGGDDSGRPRPTSFYLHAYVATTDPGKTWIAPVLQEGQSQVVIDGTQLTPSRRTDKWGGNGQYVDLDKGLHRVEIFTASKPGTPYTQGKFLGHMYLTWKTPTMSAKELGDLVKPGQPHAGTPAWAARVVKDHEIVQSGKTYLTEAKARSGGPVAIIKMEPKQNFWFEGEDQLGIYNFKAVDEGNPKNTAYTWTFENGARATGSTVKWLVPGLQEHKVTLTASSGSRRSSQTLSYFGYASDSTDMNSGYDRREFRYAMMNVLKAYPLNPDPCMRWSSAYWNTLIRTMEYGKGYPLLENLLGKRLHTATQKVPPQDLQKLQSIFLEVTPRVDPKKALQYVESFQKRAAQEWKSELRILEAEIRMIYLGQMDEAEKILLGVIQMGSEAGINARIRLGDLYLKKGDLNKAAELYANVQRRVRHQRQGRPPPGERPIEGWKLGAAKDASFSKEVGQLVTSGEHLKARETLDDWERNFPLSKIAEDFVLKEAELYMSLGDWIRARWLLEGYCRHMDLSSYLPDAAMALLTCMEEMKEPKSKLKETIDFLKDRLKHHPVVKDFEGFITKAKPPQ